MMSEQLLDQVDLFKDRFTEIKVKVPELAKKVIKPAYQRAVYSLPRVKAMAARFSPAITGTLICYSNPHHTIEGSNEPAWDMVDGWHRFKSAELANYRGELRILLFYHPKNRSESECAKIGARMFVAYNDKVNMGALDFFNAQVLAEDPRALEVVEAMTLAGFMVPKKGTSHWPRDGDPYLSQVRFLYRSELDLEEMASCLACLKDSAEKFSDQAKLRKTFLRTEFIYGFVGLWEKASDQIDSKLMVHQLCKPNNSPSELMNEIAANYAKRGQVPPKAGNSFPAMERMIAKAYNKHRSTKYSKIDLDIL